MTRCIGRRTVARSTDAVPSGGARPAGSDPPGGLDQPADDDRGGERYKEPGPGVAFEGFAAEAADEEGVEGPDNACGGGGGAEPAGHGATESPTLEDHRPA